MVGSIKKKPSQGKDPIFEKYPESGVMMKIKWDRSGKPRPSQGKDPHDGGGIIGKMSVKKYPARA